MPLELDEGYNELLDHMNHKIKVVHYGVAKDPSKLGIECQDCRKTLIIFNKPKANRKWKRK